MSFKHDRIKLPGPLSEEDKQLPVIHCFLWSGAGMEGGKATAISQDGHMFIAKLADNQEEAWRMTGYLRDPKVDPPIWDEYLAVYPQGCRLRWVIGDPSSDPQLNDALDKCVNAESHA